MKQPIKITRYEVRTPGDGDFDWFIVPSEECNEEHYDPTSAESAELYAEEIAPAWVVRIEETILVEFN